MTERKYLETPTESAQDPTADGVKHAIAGRPLVRMPNYTTAPVCKRTEEKNELRERYDIELKDPTLNDGDRVVLICLYDPDDDDGWKIMSTMKSGHSQKPKSEVAAPHLAQALVRATLRETGFGIELPTPAPDDPPVTEYREDAILVSKPVVDWFSPIGEGEEKEDLRAPDADGFIELKPTDDRPNWPATDNEWRRQLMKEHGDWHDERLSDTAEIANDDI